MEFIQIKKSVLISRTIFYFNYAIRDGGALYFDTCNRNDNFNSEPAVYNQYKVKQCDIFNHDDGVTFPATPTLSTNIEIKDSNFELNFNSWFPKGFGGSIAVFASEESHTNFLISNCTFNKDRVDNGHAGNLYLLNVFDIKIIKTSFANSKSYWEAGNVYILTYLV